MIITCINCSKNFDLDSVLIPEKGRLLQCNGCNHKWYFKKKTIEKPTSTIIKNETTIDSTSLVDGIIAVKKESSNTMGLLDNVNVDTTGLEEIFIQDNIENTAIKNDYKKPEIKVSINRKSYNILGLIIVFIISFVALILVLDTFQKPLSSIVPNIEFQLYNLYETIKDIILFLRDLI